MTFAVLFISLFVVSLVIFFAFFPIKASWVRTGRKRSRPHSSTFCEEVYDDEEL